MTQVDLPFFTVTPAFIGGANSRGAPELRVPSLRGALRYWLRAMLGTHYGDGIDALRKEEGRLMGSAVDKDSASSIFQLRIIQSVEESKPYSKIVNLDDWGNAGYPGLAYLLFAARKTQNEKERSGLTGSFTLRVASRPGLRVSDQDWLKFYSSLWLLSHLGAIGSRSRRGAGAMQIQPCDLPERFTGWPRLDVQATSASGLQGELANGLKYFRSQFEARPAANSHPAEFDILSPDTCQILIMPEEYSSGIEALNAIGGKFQVFRNKRRPDYDTVKNAILGGNILASPVERAAFGLPIPYFYRSLEKPDNKATLQAHVIDRRSSPLIFRAVRLKTGKVVIVLVWFKSRFLPSNQNLVLKTRHGEVSGPLPNDKMIQTFLHGPGDLPKHPALPDVGGKLLEVRYE